MPCHLQHHAQDFGAGGSGHAVAWAFLRLQGLRQQQLQGEPLQLQLQLYRYKPGEPLGRAVCSSCSLHQLKTLQ
jgi:hypothetical protein